MNLKMNQNSIFAVLLRSPWWISGGIAAALYAVARMLLPVEFGLYAFFLALPFMVIAAHTGWKQLRAPSEAKVTRSLEALRAMSWTEFSAAVEAAFRRDGYTVERIQSAGADFALAKGGRTTLVGCKRWKVARTGVEPLRELQAARQARDAHDCIYIAAGEVTNTAALFGAEHNVRIIAGAELTSFLR